MEIASPHPSIVLSLGVTALVVWRMYYRIRRMIGRQKLVTMRPWATVLLLPLLLAMLLIASLAHPINLVNLLAGIACGGALGVYGLRLTRFEATPQGLFYTPSAHLGIALSLLFVGRLVYRLTQAYLLLGSATMSSTDFFRNPITLAIFGTLAGYYVAYAAGLIRWTRRVAAAARPDSQFA